MPQHITVVEYDPEWPLKYAQERDRITEILKGNCIAIYHIGSTSVPGLPAKPIIDIMVAVRSLAQADAADPRRQLTRPCSAAARRIVRSHESTMPSDASQMSFHAQ